MRLLLTNDDCVDADGVQALHDSVRQCFGEAVEIVVVAPDRGRSECGHSVTTGRALQIEQIRPDWMSVDGTPVDCVRAALGLLEKKVDCVLSGVNAGANLGVDLLVSGTFAAAREAAICGIPAMAVSHYRHPDIPRTWSHVPTWMAETIREFCGKFQQDNRSSVGTSPALLWNVNLPAIHPEAGIPPLVRCEVDTEPMTRRTVLDGKRLRFDADFHARPRRQGSDVDRCFSGSMTISEWSRPFRT